MSGAPQLSNRLADLAERAGEAARAYRRGTIEAIGQYLRGGQLLAEARAECRRGEWGAVLARAGIGERAGRLMVQAATLARETGADAAAVHDAGGIQAFVAMGAASGERPDAEKPALSAGNGAAEPTPLAPPKPAATASPPRAPSLYQRRREAGLCGGCGQPSSDKARCPSCREAVAARGRRRRQLARTGEALAPRLAEAAETGSGLHLTAAEVADLARAGER